MKESIAFDQLERFGEGNGSIETVPLTRVPKIRQVETIPADVLQPGKRCIELWSDGIRAIGAEALDEPILVPVPLPGNVNGVGEGGGLNPGQITRLEHLGDEPLASRRNGCLLGLRWLGLAALAGPDPLPSAHIRSLARLLLFLPDFPQIAGQLARFRGKNSPVGSLGTASSGRFPRRNGPSWSIVPVGSRRFPHKREGGRISPVGLYGDHFRAQPQHRATCLGRRSSISASMRRNR